MRGTTLRTRAPLALTSLVVAAAAVAGAAGPAAAADLQCGTRTIDGTKYVGTAIGGVSCAFARPWVPRLVRQRGVKKRLGSVDLKGPTGYVCRAVPYGATYPFQLQGGCISKADSRRAFLWKMKLF